MSQEDFDLGFSRKEIIARTHAVEADKTHYPVHIMNARCESSSDGGADTGVLDREVSAVLVLDIASSRA